MVQVLDVSPVAPAASLEVGFVEIRGQRGGHAGRGERSE